MATIRGPQPGNRSDAARSSVVLASAVTATGDSTNTADRGDQTGGAILQIVNVGTGSPTFTFTIQGSVDGTNFVTIPYATIAAPGTAAVAAITITSSATNWYWLLADFPWRYLKINISALTTETVTATVFFPAV